MYRNIENFPNDGTKDLWLNFSISGVNRIIREGMRNITVKSEQITPFASTKPISLPILNLIRAITIKPTIVVAPLESIERQASLRADSIAGFISMPLFL